MSVRGQQAVDRAARLAASWWWLLLGGAVAGLLVWLLGVSGGGGVVTPLSAQVPVERGFDRLAASAGTSTPRGASVAERLEPFARPHLFGLTDGQVVVTEVSAVSAEVRVVDDGVGTHCQLLVVVEEAFHRLDCDQRDRVAELVGSPSGR